jgi:hypothetical protein
MVLCPPRPVELPGPASRPEPADPFPDPAPISPGPAPFAGPAPLAGPPGPPWPRRSRTRILVVALAGLVTAALALGLAALSPGQAGRPGSHSRPRALERGPAIPPRGVITQARARQRRRHRNITAAAAATGAEAAGRAGGFGSPPRHGQRSGPRPDHGGGLGNPHQTTTGSAPALSQWTFIPLPGRRDGLTECIQGRLPATRAAQRRQASGPTRTMLAGRIKPGGTGAATSHRCPVAGAGTCAARPSCGADAAH